jgi:arabinose-5-phosphate isomerase
MSTNFAARRDISHFDHIRYARDILRKEADGILSAADRITPDSWGCAVRLLLECRGRVVVSGIGKAGLVGRKIAATLASTGTPSHFLHPAEAIHGDLGSLVEGDVVLVLSFSGETEEIVRLLPSLEQAQVALIALTGAPGSRLGQAATVVLDLGPLPEACGWGLAPSTSTTAMLAVGDALALLVSHLRGFSPEDFVKFHPGGSLGRKLTRVEEVMRPLGACRLARQDAILRQVLEQSCPGRRTGAIMLVDEAGCLTGIFTDSDLARLVAHFQDARFDEPIERVMIRSPKVVRQGAGLDVALAILEQHRISELPVVDDRNIAVGMIDITDLIGRGAPVPAAATHESEDLAPPWTIRFPAPSESNM